MGWNMALTPEQVGDLLKMIELTKEVELSCPDCVELLDQYAQRVLDGAPVDGDLQRVRDHLAVCPFCDEECRLILEALRAIQGQ